MKKVFIAKSAEMCYNICIGLYYIKSNCLKWRNASICLEERGKDHVQLHGTCSFIPAKEFFEIGTYSAFIA